MKECWTKEIEAFEKEHKQPVKKTDFVQVFGQAYLKAFTPDTVKAAFRATEVCPFDPSFITEDQMKPSIPTSIKGSFPLPQPSPVRAVMASFRAQPPTTFDTSEDAYLVPLDNETPDTPTQKRTIHPTMDTSLYTPTKRRRILYGALASTSSGSYLVSKRTITSDQPIPPLTLDKHPPLGTLDRSLLVSPSASRSCCTRTDITTENKRLREELRLAHQHIAAQCLIIESDQAQLVVQNLHLQKQNEALHSRENQPVKERERLFGGKGAAMMAEEFFGAVAAAKEAKDVAAVAKDKKAQTTAAKKAAQEALDAEWKRMLSEWEAAVKKWEEECERLRDGGARKKDLPKKPLRPKKPVLEVVVDDEDKSGSEEE